jgi:hypothetical protein
VHGKGSFNPDTTRNFSYGKGFAITFALTPENKTLENLDSLFLSFTNFNVDFQGVAGLKVRDIHTQAVLFDLSDGVHFFTSPGKNNGSQT